MRYNNLFNHLNNQITANNSEHIDESLILGAIVATTCLTYAVAPVLNTEFMKSVGQGLGSLLGTIGGLFGGKGVSLSKRNSISELLQKNPDDLTGKEKEQLRKLANDKKLRNDLSNNELKALNKALGKSATDLDNDEDDTDVKSNKDKNENTPKADENKSPISSITEALLAFANLANKNEKDEAKKAENEAMIDIISASCYDENGDEIPADQRVAKMKELVGDDNWESFKKDLEDKQKTVNEDEFKEALEKASKDIKAEDVEKMKKEQKDRAKAAGERIKKENEEKAKVDEELKKLNEDPNADKKKIEELQKKKEDLIKLSTLGKASPNTAKSAIERISKDEESKEPKKDEESKEPKKDEESKEPKKDEESKEPKKDEDGNIIKDEEITDPETGKKIKVKTHTGPRGGKFYYPDGKPKKPENKVYVQENKYTSLSDYLINSVMEGENNKIFLDTNDFINESAIATAAITSKRLATIYITKAIRFAKKYFKLAFKIFNDLNMYEKLKDLDNNKDALTFIRSVVTDKNTNLNNPKDIAIVTGIILAIWYITKWKKSETEQYIKKLDTSIYNDVKPELALIQ